MAQHVIKFNTRSEYEEQKNNLIGPYIVLIDDEDAVIYSDSVSETTPSSLGIHYTGHADVEGLRAIGWTDEDIEYFQKNGVDWNEEDDDLYKVTDDNKSLYGVLTASNIATYKERIVYLPKIDTSAVTNMGNMFSGCYNLIAIPYIETKNVTDMGNMFSGCRALRAIPKLNTGSVTNMMGVFSGCASLLTIPSLDTHSATSMAGMFNSCTSLLSVPSLDTTSVTRSGNMFNACARLRHVGNLSLNLNTTFSSMFTGCNSLISIPLLDVKSATTISNMFSGCYAIKELNIKNLNTSLSFSNSPFLSKESLLYMINNEAATSAITITLSALAKTRLQNDADVKAALSNHPLITLA